MVRAGMWVAVVATYPGMRHGAASSAGVYDETAFPVLQAPYYDSQSTRPETNQCRLVYVGILAVIQDITRLLFWYGTCTLPMQLLPTNFFEILIGSQFKSFDKNVLSVTPSKVLVMQKNNLNDTTYQQEVRCPF